ESAMARSGLLLTTLLLASIVLPGTGLRAETSAPAARNTEWSKFGEPGNAVAPRQTIRITVTDNKFIPALVTVARGQTVTFEIRSVGRIKHEFVIGDAAFHAQHEREMAAMPDMEMNEANAVGIPPGQTRSLTWRFTKPGDLVFACDL